MIPQLLFNVSVKTAFNTGKLIGAMAVKTAKVLSATGKFAAKVLRAGMQVVRPAARSVGAAARRLVMAVPKSRVGDLFKLEAKIAIISGKAVWTAITILPIDDAILEYLDPIIGIPQGRNRKLTNRLAKRIDRAIRNKFGAHSYRRPYKFSNRVGVRFDRALNRRFGLVPARYFTPPDPQRALPKVAANLMRNMETFPFDDGF